MRYPSILKYQKLYLDALHERAIEDPRKPYMGYREIAAKTQTSTKTLHEYLPNLLRENAVRTIKVGKRNKYYITESGEKYTTYLGHRISLSKDVDKMMMSKDSSFITVELPASRGGATAYFKPSLAYSVAEAEEKEMHSLFESTLETLQKKFPDKKIRAILTSNPSEKE